MSVHDLPAVLGCCALLNIALMALSAIGLVFFRNAIAKLHSRMFGMDESALSAAYFRYLAQYKLLVLVFNIIPYVAMKIVLNV